MILIIDDGFDIVLLIRTSIEKLGLSVILLPITRSLEGVSLHYLDYNLVISDIRMLNMNDYKFVQELKR